VSRQRYYEKFKAVEIQQTFYQPPRPETAQKWRVSVPDDFEFTLKAWQIITHASTSPTYRRMRTRMSEPQKKECGFFKPTDAVFKAWEATEKIASILKAKVIVFQCPSSFTPCKSNTDNMRDFFKAINRKRYRFVWEPRGKWPEKYIKSLCEDLDLVHCADPFSAKILHGDIRYLRLHGVGGHRHRYKGLDLKRLRDFCENEARLIKRRPFYVFFNNVSMIMDAQRFEWIVKNTGKIKALDITFLKNLCREIEMTEEDEKVQMLSREAERIVSLILHTDYARVDIEIEKAKLREMCKSLFPDKVYLYENIYGKRFDRLWEQFREAEDTD